MENKCIKCGSGLEENTNFCNNCGIKIEKNKTVDIQYFFVSPAKFIILSIVSFGIFDLIWFYKNWFSIKKAEKSDIYPFWRSIFRIFTSFELFDKILSSAKSFGYKKNYSGGFLAFLYLVFSVIIRVLDKTDFSNKDTWILYFILFVFRPFIFIPIQDAILFNNRHIDEESKYENKITTGQLVISLALPLLIFLFAIVPLFRSSYKEVNDNPYNNNLSSIQKTIDDEVNKLKLSTSFPEKINNNVYLTDIESDQMAFHYYMSVIDSTNLIFSDIKYDLIKNSCSNNDIKKSLNYNIAFNYTYHMNDTGQNYFIHIIKDDCK